MAGDEGSEVVIVHGVRSSGLKKARYADLEALPDNVVGELLDGELFASPRPASRHTLAASALGGELYGPFHQGKGGPGGWWIIDEPELHFGEDVLVPDLAGWRRERLPEFPDAPFFTLAPDWVCEVLSPSTARLDLTRKLPRYAEAGVQHAWMVDPANRVVEVFRLDRGQCLLVGAGSGRDLLRAAPFDAMEIQLGALWPD